ncbi:MAG: DinB family protein [Treponema sp.]|jgi:hypothetical protein|nr:DinB family protein [Treponema sp.]
MKFIPDDWTLKQNNLKKRLSKEQFFDEGIELLLEMHSLLHDKEVYKNTNDTLYDNLWDNLKEETCKRISNKETSIIWNIWHITRIEDIVANILIGNTDEILSADIQTKLNINIKDTGNAMNYNEINFLNENINIKALNEYRVKVGKQTRRIIKNLKFIDMKIIMEETQLNKIIENGGLLEHEKSKWLLDFWGKKNVLGLIAMPITRHQTMHLNDCFTIKENNQKAQNNTNFV